MMIVAQKGHALLLDAGQTLVFPAEPIGETYIRYGSDFGVSLEPEVIQQRFIKAYDQFEELRKPSHDWHEYWSAIVSTVTGCADPKYLEVLREHFTRPQSWTIAEGARDCCQKIRERGMVIAIVSNWDDRLRTLLTDLGVAPWMDEIIVSGEELIEKPDPKIFRIACERLGIPPNKALHVGDSLESDVLGARSAGCQALHWGHDVKSFKELEGHLLRSK